MEWIGELHRFWYGEQDVFDRDYTHLFDRWYRGGEALDREIRERFAPLLAEAAADFDRGDTARWTPSPRARHVLVLLFDQLPRNMFRGSARMFAHDPLAVALVHAALDDGSYDELAPIEQLFMAVALEHSERLADVERSARLMADLAANAPEPQQRRFRAMRRYNRDHLRVVRRFGRYPHRNQLLGRDSTAEELEFLATTSYRWMRSVYPASR